MTLQSFVWILRSLVLLSGLVFGALIITLDPDIVSWYGAVLVYVLGVILGYGIFALAVVGGYRLGFGDQAAAFAIGAALRQAFLVTLLCVGLLFLYKLGLLLWWAILLLVAVCVLLEFSLR